MNSLGPNNSSTSIRGGNGGGSGGEGISLTPTEILVLAGIIGGV